MSVKHIPKGHTGHRVESTGTYRCEDGVTWTYVRGDEFRPCPSTGKSTVWIKTDEPKDPDHPQR